MRGGIEVVLLDVGATLVDSRAPGPAKQLAALLGLGDDDRRRLDAALMTTAFGGPAEVAAYVRAAFVADAAAPVENAAERVWEGQLHHAVALDGASAAVGALHRAGLRVGLVSNVWEPFLVSARRCLPDVFDTFAEPELRVYSYELGAAKPDPSVYRRAVELAGVPPERIAMVGDSYARDVRPAMDAGMRAVWVLRRPDRERRHVDAVRGGAVPAPARTVASVAEVTPELVADLAAAPVAGGAP